MVLKNMGKNYHGKNNIWIYTDSVGVRHRLVNNNNDIWSSCINALDAYGCKLNPEWYFGYTAYSRANLIIKIEKELLNGMWGKEVRVK